MKLPAKICKSKEGIRDRNTSGTITFHKFKATDLEHRRLKIDNLLRTEFTPLFSEFSIKNPVFKAPQCPTKLDFRWPNVFDFLSSMRK